MYVTCLMKNGKVYYHDKDVDDPIYKQRAEDAVELIEGIADMYFDYDKKTKTWTQREPHEISYSEFYITCMADVDKRAVYHHYTELLKEKGGIIVVREDRRLSLSIHFDSVQSHKFGWLKTISVRVEEGYEVPPSSGKKYAEDWDTLVTTHFSPTSIDAAIRCFIKNLCAIREDEKCFFFSNEGYEAIAEKQFKDPDQIWM